jgi:hypothetical protein
MQAPRVDRPVYPRRVELITHAEEGNRQPAEPSRQDSDRRLPQDHVAVALAPVLGPSYYPLGLRMGLRSNLLAGEREPHLCGR